MRLIGVKEEKEPFVFIFAHPLVEMAEQGLRRARVMLGTLEFPVTIKSLGKPKPVAD
jgi:hypothetical protein